MPTVLLTGFEPFDQEPINPSWEVARALDGRDIGGARVVARQLPCVFGAALDTLAAAIAEVSPALVICVGQAGGRTDISIERVAINVDDARIPDNAAQQPIDAAIVAGGPAAYFSRLPIKAIVRDLRAAGLPASVSQTAGTFVCNHVFYGLMHQLAQQSHATRGGFIHIPYLPEQAARHPGAPSLSQLDMIRAIEQAIATSLSTSADVAIGGGATH